MDKEIAPRFKPGDRVVVRRAYPIGHVRTPYYIRGCVGEIERICGAFRNPEELAYARLDTARVPLYRVRFAQNTVWPDYRGNLHDSVDIEIYQHWLEPA
jgi:nitrile hydratase subunit beta